MSDKNRFYTQLLDALEQGQAVTLMTSLGTRKGQKAFLLNETLTVSDESLRPNWERAVEMLPETMPQILETGNGPVLYERVCARPKLIICGGGHVAQPLGVLGRLLDFEVTVIDDRPEFANADRFPGAEILCMPYQEALEKAPRGADCYFVIVTPGHIADRECLETILKNNQYAYVGMIGSRRKVGLLREELLEQGYSEETVDGIHMPIGLRIGAKTPAEIATCIAAQLIEVRSGTDGGFDRDGLRAMALGTPMVLCTIIKKNGSAPRGVGARLMVDKEGHTYGTIGGGEGEAAAVNAAPKVLEMGKARFLEHTMQNSDAHQAGMICGGTVTVLMEPVN